jgi:hypothetical protein
MANAAVEDRWFHTSWLCHVVVNSHPRQGKKKFKPVKPNELNPLRLLEKQRRLDRMTTKEKFKILKAQFFGQ